MDRDLILQKIKDSGVVGAGGAGFPTHVKLNCSAEVVIANGAECEPLLRTDRTVMELYAPMVIAGLKACMEAAGAKRGVIATKKKYTAAIEALKSAIGSANIEFLLMESYYPAGDEQQIVYEAMGKVVPTGGLPLDVGAVVQNVSTLADVANALKCAPLTEKLVTVNGEVKNPAVFRAPIGASVRSLIAAAGGPDDLSGYSVVIGGPMMGRITSSPDEPVTKTTGGILVFPKEHPLIQKRTGSLESDLKLARSVCCQCNFCTQMCPRNALGLKVEPHKVMRGMALGAPDFGEANGIFSCCDCGLCTLFACNFSLAPSRMMQRAKQELGRQGVKPVKKTAYPVVSGNISDIKVPTHRLLARLDIARYDRDMPLVEKLHVQSVRLPLKMHIGAPAKPVVKTGGCVVKGQLIAEAQGLGADIHASIAGRAQVLENEILIEE